MGNISKICPKKPGRIIFYLALYGIIWANVHAAQWVVNKATVSWLVENSTYYAYSNEVQTEILDNSSPTWVVIDSFENDRNQADETNVPDAAWWTADGDVYSYPVISTMSFNGSSSLEVNYDKSAEGGKPLAILNAGDLDNGSNNVSDFSVSASSSISLQVYPVGKDIDILMRLRDINANESNDLQTLNAGTTGQWQRLTWTWSAASLDACDVTRIKEVELLFAPGDSSETGKVYIDDLKLEDLGSNVKNVVAILSTTTLSVSLYWPAAGDEDGNLKEYHLYRSTNDFNNTSDAGVSLIVSTTSLKYGDNSGLQYDTTYYYSVVAEDVSGYISVKTRNVSAKTVSLDAPAAPAGFSGTALSAGSIEWTWSDTSFEDGYRVKNDTDGVIKELSAGAADWVETGLAGNTSYYRYVEAYNGGGASSSAFAVVYTLANPPSNLIFAGVFSSSITISWTLAPDGAFYGIAKSDDNFSVNIDTIIAFADSSSINTEVITNLSQKTTYWFRVWSYNGDAIETAAIENSTRTTVLPTVAAVSLDKSEYFTLFSSAVITVTDNDRNLDNSLKEIIVSSVTSTTDSTGISIILEETDVDSGVFKSTTALIFSSYTSVNNSNIKVYDGDTITVRYYDEMPSNTYRTDIAGYYSMDTTAGQIFVEQNAPGISDIIKGKTSSVNSKQTIYVYDVNRSTLAQLTVTSDANGVFTIDLGDNQTYGATPDPDTGEIIIYIATADSDPSNWILLKNDVKCVVREPRISMEIMAWGEGVDYLIGEAGAMEPGGNISLASSFGHPARKNSVKVYDKSSNINADGSFKIAVGDKYRKYSDIYATFIDGALNTAFVSKNAPASKYELLQNAPNPFKVDRDVFTVLNYSIVEDSDVKLRIYNIAGELVKILVDEYIPAGRHKVKWYGDNGDTGEDTGEKVGSGVYIYVLETERFSASGKIVLIR